MEKNIKSKRRNFGKIIIALLLCLFCSFSFAGCIGRFVIVGGSSGGSGGSGGGNGGSGGSGGGTQDPEEDEPFGDGVSIKDYNDVFLCAIGVYQIEGNEDAFYDKNTGNIVSYDFLVDRQFDTMATYIYSTLNRIYGTSTSESLVIEGFGDDKAINYGNLISDDNQNQKIIAGLSSGQLTNSSFLNYKNAINGGYAINEPTDNGDGTYSITYNTATTVAESEWIGKSYFSQSRIKNTLGYIYKNQKHVARPDNALGFGLDSDTQLRNHYEKVFRIDSEDIINFDFSTIDSLGITNEYIWNVAYYIAFSMIGRSNMETSINSARTIFTANKINDITTTNLETYPTVLQNYKGYNLILSDLMSNLKNLNVESNTQMSVTSMNTDNTCFPVLKKEMYLYYDNINDLCDANNDALSGEGDGDYNISEDGEDFDESEFDNVDVGTAFRLSRIILLPRIENNISSFDITGFLLGFQAQDTGTYQVELSISGLDVEGEKIEPTELKLGDSTTGNSKVTYDETYKMSEDLVDVTVDLGTEISNIEFGEVPDVQKFVENSFRDSSRTVEYASGGSKTLGFGYLNVYNSLIDSIGNLTATKNYLELNFDYYSSNGNALADIPMTYLMYFYIM